MSVSSDRMYLQLQDGTMLPMRSVDGVIQVSSNGSTWTDLTGAASTDCITKDWFGAMQNAFATNTGLSGFSFSEIYRNDFADTNRQVAANSAGQGFQLNTGTAVYTNLPGGVIQVDSAVAGYADWSSDGTTLWNTLPNIRTKRWMVAYRLAIGSNPAAASKISAGIYTSGGTFVGLGFAGAAATWTAGRGATPMATVVADTGKAITVSTDGTNAAAYLSIAIGNFDLSNWSYIIDAVSSTTAVTVEAVSNLPNEQACPYVSNYTSTLRHFFDAAAVYIER